MANNDDSDFEVFLTISEYRKYQNMQKVLEEKEEAQRKERASAEERIKNLERAADSARKELAERNEAINQISVECLRVKKQLQLANEKIVKEEFNWEKSKVAQLEKLEQSTVDKLSAEKKLADVAQRLEQLEGENRSLLEAVEKTNVSSKALETALRSELKSADQKSQCLLKKLREELAEREAIENETLIELKLQKEELNRYQSEGGEYKQRFTTLAKQLESEKKHKNDLEVQVKESESVILTLKSKITDLEVELKRMLCDFEAIRFETSAHKKTADDQLAARKLQAAETEKLKSVINELQATVQTRKHLAEQLANKLEHAIGTAKQLEERALAAENRAQTLDKKLREQAELQLQPQNPSHENKYSRALASLLEAYSALPNFEELKEQINGLTILEEEYEGIIDENRLKLTELSDKNSQLQNQLAVSEARLKLSRENEEAMQVQMRKINNQMLNSSRLLEDVMKEKNDGKNEVELLLAKEDAELLQKQLKDMKVQMAEMESTYQLRMKEIRNEACSDHINEIKMLKDVLNNPSDYFSYYFNQYDRELKDIGKNELDNMREETIDDLIKQLGTYRPVKGHSRPIWNPHISKMRPPFP